jgi:hypothetical protein
MPFEARSDTGYVDPGRRAYIAVRRHLLGAAVCATLFALCVLCCAAASTAPAATPANSASSHASAPAKHGRRHCARHASFHSSGGKPTGKRHGRKHRAGCGRRRHAGHHHNAPTHHAPSPSNGSCPETKLQPSAANLQRVRAATLCLVNRERTSRGLSALGADRPLQQAAQAHSEDMA